MSVIIMATLLSYKLGTEKATSRRGAREFVLIIMQLFPGTV